MSKDLAVQNVSFICGSIGWSGYFSAGRTPYIDGRCYFRSRTCGIESPRFVISFKTAAIACYDQMHLSIGRPPAKSSSNARVFWKFADRKERKAGDDVGRTHFEKRRPSSGHDLPLPVFLVMRMWEVICRKEEWSAKLEALYRHFREACTCKSALDEISKKISM